MSFSMCLLTAACLASGVDTLPTLPDAAAPAKVPPAPAVAKPGCDASATPSSHKTGGLFIWLRDRLRGQDSKPGAPSTPLCGKRGASSCQPTVKNTTASDSARPCDVPFRLPETSTSPAPCSVANKPSECGKACAASCPAIEKKPASAPSAVAAKTVTRDKSYLPDWIDVRKPDPPVATVIKPSASRKSYTSFPVMSTSASPYAVVPCAYGKLAGMVPVQPITPGIVQSSASSAAASKSEIARAHVEGAGARADYGRLTGRLCFVHTAGGVWVLRYASADREDRFGGSVVLATVLCMDNYKDGDLVTVCGEVLNDGCRASRSLGGPWYRVNSIALVDPVAGTGSEHK